MNRALAWGWLALAGSGCTYPDYGFGRRTRACEAASAAVVFCSDFDADPPTTGWRVDADGALVFATDGASSPPRAAAFERVPNGTAELRHVSTRVIGARVSLVFTVRVDDFESAGTFGFASLTLGGWSVRLSARGSAGFVEEIYPDGSGVAYDARGIPLARGRFQTVSIEVDRDARTVVVSVDDVRVEKPMVVVPDAAAPTVRLGILYQSGSLPAEPRSTKIRYDDVRLVVP